MPEFLYVNVAQYIHWIYNYIPIYITKGYTHENTNKRYRRTSYKN